MSENDEARAWADEHTDDLAPGPERDELWGFYFAQYGGLVALRRSREKRRRRPPSPPPEGESR